MALFIPYILWYYVKTMQERDQTFIYGTHAVGEALRRVPHAVRHLYAVKGSERRALEELARTHGIPFDRCDDGHLPHGFDRRVVHQGVVALVSPKRVMREYRAFVEETTISADSALVVLDELTDPQNVGAIIRSAAAFGVAGVLLPEHRQAAITGAVVKVSAGMAFAVPLVSIGNVNTTLRDLKERGFWVYGLAAHGETPLATESFTRPSVFVLGSEGDGLREKTEALCDIRLSIPIDPRCESLNVAASAAVVLYAWRAQHHP